LDSVLQAFASSGGMVVVVVVVVVLGTNDGER
jgi:hypothetical protein